MAWSIDKRLPIKNEKAPRLNPALLEIGKGGSCFECHSSPKVTPIPPDAGDRPSAARKSAFLQEAGKRILALVSKKSMISKMLCAFFV
jgi:hypothetical protein